VRQHHRTRRGREDRPVLSLPRAALTLLAPEIVEAVLDGRLPKGVRLEELVRPLSVDWAEQRRMLLGGDAG
jgi:hypothetical protein